jgi:hypothetical protein
MPCGALKSSNLSLEYVISIVKIKEYAQIEEKYSSETSVNFQRTTRRYIPEDITLHAHLCENLNSYSLSFVTL